MKNQYKLLVVDVDGTLVNSSGRIADEDKQAIAKVREQGVIVALSTGRVKDACQQVLSDLNLGGCHIFFDGALIYDTDVNQNIFLRPLEAKLVTEMVYLDQPDGQYNLELYTVNRYYVQKSGWASKLHEAFFGLTSHVVDFKTLHGEEFIKAGLMVHNREERTLADRFQSHFEGRLRFSPACTPAYPEVVFVNIIDPLVSKGDALKSLSKHLGIASAEVMAIGDGTNDISLFKSAGFTVAMGNAKDGLKAVANQITLGVEECGLAAAIKQFLL